MKRSRLAALFLLFLSVLGTAAHSPPARAGQQADGDSDVIWTTWGAAHHTLLEDGESVWIGTASGLVRLNRNSGAYARFSTADGLPHRKIYAAARDSSGNRWFGGDGGLSKLTPTGEWTHYDRENSGLLHDVVDGLALGAGGDIWVSYLDKDAVGRLRPGGTWTQYPNRETAVSLAYSAVRQTVNLNNLWTVAADEVWVGYNAYDGSQWANRQPGDYYDTPRVTRIDGQNRLWALDYASGILVFRWDDPDWSTYRLDTNYDGYLTTLVLDDNDTAWVGGVLYDSRYTPPYPAYGPVPEEPGDFFLEEALNMPPGVSVLLPAPDGLWVAGPNWLHYPDGRLQRFEDVPFLPILRELFVDGHGTTWVNSAGDGTAVLQILDDRGTGSSTDDRGVIVDQPFGVTAVALASNGDPWLAGEAWGRFHVGLPPRRYYGDKLLDYQPPGVFWPNFDIIIRDIYVEDARHTWFVYMVSGFSETLPGAGIWSLDDGGTPDDFGDDVWTTYEVGWEGDSGVVAARDGRLWFGDESGVYLYNKEGWQRLAEVHARELIPAARGTLVVNDNSDPLVIAPDGRLRRRSVEDLVTQELPLVRSTTERNQLWFIAPDGAVWFWQDYMMLGRYDGRALQTFPSPVYGGHIEVDENNHVWLAGELTDPWKPRDLWRISPRPTFDLAVGPSTWFIRPQESRSYVVAVTVVAGYAKTVELSVGGLPAGVSATVDPASLFPGETAVITLTSQGASPGKTSIAITGKSGEISQTKEVTLSVVQQVHSAWLPGLLR